MMSRGGPELLPETFQAVRSLIFEVAGISIGVEKQELVRARLMTRLRALKLTAYEDYLSRIRSDPQELSNMVDVLTTNLTSFLREKQHFEYLHRELFPRWRERGEPLQIWSAGCSTGEEPYSLAMQLAEELPNAQVRILATDLSARVLRRAKAGIFAERGIQPVPAHLRAKYFTRVQGDDPPTYEVATELKQRVAFARLNLMSPWPMKGPFEVIFCRNVMIYFDDNTRSELVNRFSQLLGPEGHLFIGHAESLSGLVHPFRLVQPAVYVRAA